MTGVKTGISKKGLLGSAGALALLAFAQAAAAEEVLTFVWHAGTCADAIVDIAKDYPDKNVRIVPALVPYGPEWHNRQSPTCRFVTIFRPRSAFPGDPVSDCGIASPVAV